MNRPFLAGAVLGLGLHERGHFLGVHGVDARVRVACHKEDGGIFLTHLHMMIGRVGIEPLELLGVFGGTVFRIQSFAIWKF